MGSNFRVTMNETQNRVIILQKYREIKLPLHTMCTPENFWNDHLCLEYDTQIAGVARQPQESQESSIYDRPLLA